MTRAWGIVVLVVSLAAAGCTKDEKKREAPPEPIRVAVGDCGGGETVFVSGPRPQPFDLEMVDKMQAALATAAADAPALEADEPEEESEEEGGTGTAMALDEGKMGQEDSERASGRYSMKRGDAPPELSKKRAIEQAREAGILDTEIQGQFAALTGTADFSSGLDDRTVYGDEVGEMQGGFGTGPSGTGPGGGGTGWGTIGKGRYGTIGHGSGTGSGYYAGGGRGGMRGRKTTPPQVRIGNATAVGDLDKNIIRRYIRRKLPRIKHCYEKDLLINPILKGTVVSKFTITPEGKVLSSLASGVSDEVSSCVADVIKSIQFPKPKGGGIVQVRYPFHFRPGEGGGRVTPEPASGTRVRPKQAKPVVDYRPGKQSPLLGQEKALGACFRKQSAQAHAAAVVELTVGDDGAVTASKTYGIDSDDAASCIDEVARKLTWQKAASKTRRCAVAFGEMPVGAAPGIDIDEAVVRYRGREVAGVKAMVAGDTPEWKLPKLYAALRRDRMMLPGKVVAIDGPRVIRPVASTPMKVVYRVMKTAAAAESFDGFAAERGDQWQLLRDGAELPVVPVPFTTGASWGRFKAIGRSADVELDEEEWVKLSVLVTDKGIHLGLSRVQEIVMLTDNADGPDWARFEATLDKFRKSSFMAEPNPFGRAIEIGADDAVPYCRVVEVIDRVKKAGLADWVVKDPNALTTKFYY